MKTNEYLYGEDVEVPEIPNEVIVRRIEALKDNLSELFEVPYLERDEKRIGAIHKAIDFWENINNV